MWFWWFLLVCDTLIPVIMVIAGRLMRKRPPKKINGVIGYRSARSMKNMDTWNFAHDYCGKLWWKAGWAMLLPSILAHIPVYGGSENLIGTVSMIVMAMQIAVLPASVFLTERALKRAFTEDGVRR